MLGLTWLISIRRTERKNAWFNSSTPQLGESDHPTGPMPLEGTLNCTHVTFCLALQRAVVSGWSHRHDLAVHVVTKHMAH